MNKQTINKVKLLGSDDERREPAAQKKRKLTVKHSPAVPSEEPRSPLRKPAPKRSLEESSPASPDASPAKKVTTMQEKSFQVSLAMSVLKSALTPFVEGILRARIGESWLSTITPTSREERWDTSALLTVRQLSATAPLHLRFR